MNVCFYSRAKRPFGKGVEYNWAQIFFGYPDDDEEFEEGQYTFKQDGHEGNEKVGDVPIFYNEYSEATGWKDKEALDKIEKLCKEKLCEVVLVCDYDFFRKVVKLSDRNEIEASLFVTENSHMLYYATIGDNKCALLVAYDKISEYGED